MTKHKIVAVDAGGREKRISAKMWAIMPANKFGLSEVKTAVPKSVEGNLKKEDAETEKPKSKASKS